MYLIQFYDLVGTNLLTGSPTVGTVYKTADNTLVIKSLASSANADQLCCDWVTVAAFKYFIYNLQ